LVGAIVVASALLFVQYAPSSPYQQPWAWGGRDRNDLARLDAVDGLPDAMAVTVSPQLSAEVAERRTVIETWVAPPEDPDRWRPTTPAVILDTNAHDDNDNPLWDDDQRAAVVAALEDQGYRVVFDQRGILSFRR